MKNPRFPGKTRGFQKVGVLHCFAKVFYHLPFHVGVSASL